MKDVIKFILIVVLTVIVYVPAIQGDFVWDDDSFVVQNELLEDPEGVELFWATTKAPDYFPMVSTVLWVQRRLWGLNPMGYHIVNVAYHIMSALLVWCILVRLKIRGAWFIGLLFAIHPVNVDSVAWITQIKNTQSGIFYFLSILCYLKFYEKDKWPWYIGALAFFEFALLSKTSVIMLPVVLVLIVWYLNKKLNKRDVILSLPFFALSIIMALITLWFDKIHNVWNEDVWSAGLLERLAFAGQAVWFYAGKLIFPDKLMFVYPRWDVAHTNIISYIPGILFCAVLFFLWKYREKGTKSAFIALSCFAVSLFPMLGFANTYFMKFSQVANQWLYLASVAGIALCVNLFLKIVQYEKAYNRRLIITLATAVIIIFSVITLQESKKYTNQETLWKNNLSYDPNCSLGHSALGVYYRENGQSERAIRYLKRAIEIAPENINPALDYNILGVAYIKKNEIEKAIDTFKKALEVSEDYLFAYRNLANAYELNKSYRESIKYHYLANEQQYKYRKKCKRCIVSYDKRHYLKTIQGLKRAIKLEPSAENYYRLGVAYGMVGYYDEEIESYKKSLSLHFDNSVIYYQMGVAYGSIGDMDSEIGMYEKAKLLGFDTKDMHNNMAVIYYYRRDYDSAIYHADYAINMGMEVDANLLEKLEKYRTTYE